jgi:crotonobetainyl-CoA:carnitine CoA-transferase CaiB-like acyl-CoA transferase
MWRKSCSIIGREDLITHPDFCDQKGRSGKRQRLNAELERTLAQRISAHWVNFLHAAGVACGPIYRVDEMFENEQVRRLDLIRDEGFHKRSR